MALFKPVSRDFVFGSRQGLVRSVSRNRILIRSHSYSGGEEAKRFVSPEQSVLESLPQEILIKIICGVNHDDLKQLLYVSKSIHEAAKIAKELHFAYATPSKVPALWNLMSSSPGELKYSEDEKAPNAPMRIALPRRRSLEKNKDGMVSIMVRSNSEDFKEERWLRRKLFN